MIPELAALSATAVVHFGTVTLAQSYLTRDIGLEANAGPRDGIEDRLSAATLRLRRATANFIENIGPFIIAVVVVVLADKTSMLTAVLAWGFVAARVLYVPAYLLGWTPWRSLIWVAGAICTFGLLLAGWL